MLAFVGDVFALLLHMILPAFAWIVDVGARAMNMHALRIFIDFVVKLELSINASYRFRAIRCTQSTMLVHQEIFDTLTAADSIVVCIDWA